ncbi:GNAT family N-acetyltransferase [Sphingopyxis sp.]|uniref:GNAT family N-acetyltransferase n=1 Tax=Sphingopyxis sp. TaxID=1908224 RepID=UPI00258AB522|nr:GNAT family N-acetyltransferase [Sphingopyxis sp.]
MIAIDGTALALNADPGIPEGARRLIWEEFFRSRDRGVDWSTHLPWAIVGEAICVSVTDSSVTAETGARVAALVIRRLHDTPAAMAGFVCVAPSHRGLGLSRIMLDFAASILAEFGLKEMLLWTGTPAVYKSSGFTLCEQEQRWTMRGMAAQGDYGLQLDAWPSASTEPPPGLPPFATAAWQATSDKARIVFADTPKGSFLLDMHGGPDAITRAMFTARPGQWTMFASERRQPVFHAHVVASGYLVQSCPGPCTLRRPLGTVLMQTDYVPPAFRI